MSFITKTFLNNYADIKYQNFTKAAPNHILSEEVKSFSITKKYDIFLSHAYLDAKEILGLKKFLESLNFSVYVDWIEDKGLDRTSVTKETAELIRERMKSCRSLIYAYSYNSPDSRWMAWELGFFDGYDGKVCVMPVVEQETSEIGFKGLEFLGIYPYATPLGGGLVVNDSMFVFVDYKLWLTGSKPTSKLLELLR